MIFLCLPFETSHWVTSMLPRDKGRALHRQLSFLHSSRIHAISPALWICEKGQQNTGVDGREVLSVENSSAGDERRMVTDACSPSGAFFPSGCWGAFCPWDQPRIYARPQRGACAGTRTVGVELRGGARARRGHRDRRARRISAQRWSPGEGVFRGERRTGSLH